MPRRMSLLGLSVDIRRATRTFAIAAILSLTPLGAHAATCVWKAASAANFNASTANWSCGAIPGSADSVYFCNGACQSTSGTNVNCTITSGITVSSINLGTSYSAIVSAGTSTVDISGDFTQSTGTFSAPSTRLSVGGAFTKTGGTFTHSSGTVELRSTASKTFATNGATFNNLSINDGLVGYWKLDETSGTTVADSSGSGNTGTRSATGATWQASVPTGMDFTDVQSLALDGSTGNVSLGVTNLPAASAAQTISVWAKLNSTTGVQDLVSLTNQSNSGVQLEVKSGNLGVYNWGGGTLIARTAPSTGVWHHIACTYNGASGQTLYVDGVATTATVANQSGSTTTAYLGTYSPNNEMYNGSLDDVRIYNRALSSTEITALANGGFPGSGTQNVTGNPTITGDLFIRSGSLAAGSATISVAGNWWNYSGLFSAGTGTVMFNGSSAGKSILVNGQTFNNVTISGAGAWSIADSGSYPVFISGTLSQSAGTFTSTAGLLRLGNFSNTGGTFTHNSGTVMLSSTSSQTFASNGATFNDLAINDSLAGYWKLDENTGTSAADGSGYGNDGTLTNGPTWTTSLPTLDFKNTSGVTFDGTNDYIDIGAAVTPNNAAFTTCAWVKFNGLTGYQELASIDGTNISGFFLERDTGGYFTMTMRSVDNISTTTYAANGTTIATTGTWYHVCGVYTGSVARVYVNGAQEGSDVTVSSTWLATGHTIIGACKWNGSYTSYLNGSLDEVRIYSRALSAAEVNSLYGGGQPGTSLGTYSMTGSPTVSGDLTIAGGLDIGTSTISLAGNFWNYGGTFVGTYWNGATIALTGSSTTNYIRSGGQVLANINITGSGKWTLADPLDVDPNDNVTLTTGSMDIGTYTLRTGGLLGGSGTFTGTSGTVVLDGNSDRALSVGSFNILRVEDPSTTNLAGYWKLDESQGISARDWTGNGHTGTLTNSPLWSSSVPPTVEYYDPGSLSFNGTSSYVDAGAAATPSNAALTACAWVNFTGISGNQTMVSVDGTNISSFYFKKNSSNKFNMQFWASDSTGAALYDATGTTTVTTATWYHVCGVYTGGVARVYVNGSQEGSDATVSGTFSATGHTIIGASKWNGARADYVNGLLDDVRLYNVALTSAQIKALGNGRYPSNAGVATHTLGANLTVGSTLALDSGGLSTSTYTVNLANSDATKITTVSAGTYTEGAGTTNFKGGLTVRNEGTLALANSSGVAALGSGKTLVIDGTLNASTAGNTPTIQSVSGTYTFTVGSSATATPILNINGLAVKNTGVDGMYINTVAGSSTTFTKFDNLAFSNGYSGSGGTFLRIYSTALTLISSGSTFTFAASKPDYAVKLAGNGTGDGETRALFGNTLCPSSLCVSSNKSDDDADNNGVGDNPGSNAAVVQFVRASPTDTAGAIEGFPTAAFDWNTFTYYSTYVAYRNYSGSQDRLFVRASSGAPGYSWDLPTAAGHIVGTPRWTQISSVKYVYVGTTAGYVYKLVDNTSSLALAPSPWDTPYCYGGSPCSANDSITSPLEIDATNVYWVGTDSASSRKCFVLTQGKTLTSAALSIPAAVTAAAAEATISSIDYLFAGMQGFLYKIKISDQSSTSWTQPATTSTINGRVTALFGLAYLPDNLGHIYAVNTSTLATDWTYQDTGNHGGTCTDGGSCTIKSLYADYNFANSSTQVMYGDQDGHIYSISKNGAGATVMTGYPMQPAAGEAITTAPLYRSGIIVVGTSSGSVFVINRKTASAGTPATLATYKLGSAVSTVSYNSNTNSGAGAYMVGTANGNLFFIDAVTDPDAYQ